MGAAYKANLLIGPVFSLQKRRPYNRDWLYLEYAICTWPLSSAAHAYAYLVGKSVDVSLSSFSSSLGIFPNENLK